MGGRLRSHGPVTQVRYEREWPGDLMYVTIDDRIRIRYPEKLGDEREDLHRHRAAHRGILRLAGRHRLGGRDRR
jgi:hypothetical protein